MTLKEILERFSLYEKSLYNRRFVNADQLFLDIRDSILSYSKELFHQEVIELDMSSREKLLRCLAEMSRRFEESYPDQVQDLI